MIDDRLGIAICGAAIEAYVGSGREDSVIAASSVTAKGDGVAHANPSCFRDSIDMIVAATRVVGDHDGVTDDRNWSHPSTSKRIVPAIGMPYERESVANECLRTKISVNGGVLCGCIGVIAEIARGVTKVDRLPKGNGHVSLPRDDLSPPEVKL